MDQTNSSRWDGIIDQHSLLRHPFYQAWQQGVLTREDLQIYAKEYYHLESEFPRFLSRVHSQMEDPVARGKITQNLVSEELDTKSHRELWLDFANSIGVAKEEIVSHKPSSQTRRVIENFFELCSSSWASGVAALYAYESQQPKIAETKKEGLIKFYGLPETSQGLEFFRVHENADQWHSRAEREILTKAEDPGIVEASLSSAARALWRFLDGISEQIRLQERFSCSLS